MANGNRSRLKGQRGERAWLRLVYDRLSDLLPEAWKLRDIDQTQVGGGDKTIGPFLVEVKWDENISVGRAWRQAKGNSSIAGKRTVLVYKRNREPFIHLVEMDIDQFCDYVSSYLEGEK